MIRKATGRKRGAWTRAIAGLLTLALLCGLLPAIAHETASATTWADEYLDQVVEWGVMRGDTDGDLYPTRNITRAEFAAMINRAYGYTEVGPIPFTDVDINAWYYDDIAIAYNMGYLNGTSATTVSPDEALSREQAVVILARNMMLEDSTGEVLGFSDSREFASWSRNKIQAAVEAGLINGYPDGTFRPNSSITREEVAVVLSRAIGTLVQEPGTHILGSVYGNVVVNSSGVTLRNTTIAGDLYLTGGIGLGDVLLENVNVLGKIVVSGAGESNKGDASVILRNVTANKMVMDNANNQFITLRTEGNTAIQSTSVRTSAYLDDATGEGKGLLYIELDGEDGTTLQLAGNIKEVLNITPDSHLVLAAGTAEKITIDEKAVDASMAIEMDATVKELNLDVGTSVSGDGDIKSLVVNAAGCTVSMLPDQITIRPGLTANIHGEVMNSSTAAESSSDPRLTASYPTVKDIAPNSATAVFSSNKAGTIYWAITALADGSTSEADLISPPVYGGAILQSGTIDAEASKTEYTAELTDLLSDGSYYLTTVMVDGRGLHSPVKVTAFTTPDDTVPAFTETPTMSQVSTANAQVTVMPNKSCLMYYALLPKNGVAPTAADFKAASITGNLGYGSVDVTKNTTLPVDVNSVDLEELTDYVLYLWLTDYDSAKSSAVVSVPFTTADETPPTITYLSQTDAQETTITMTFALDEPGTFYWAAVKSGDTFLRPISGQNVEPELDDEAAIIQTTSGVGALQKGSVTVAAGDTDYTFTITGLTGETTYDLYYIAMDSAGNYSLGQNSNGDTRPMVQKTTASTLDTNPPTVEQRFTKYNGEDTATPLPDTDIELVFNERIAYADYYSTPRGYYDLLDLYNDRNSSDDAMTLFLTALESSFTLYQVVNGRAAEVTKRNEGNEETVGNTWVIDYRNVRISQEDGQMVVTFPTKKTSSGDDSASALNLAAGATYYFRINENTIADVASPPNLRRSGENLPTFRTVYAQVNLSENETSSISVGSGDTAKSVRIDMAFEVEPTSVDRVADTERWDILFWCDVPVTFKVYRAEKGAGNATLGNWESLGEGSITTTSGTFKGTSLTSDIRTESGKQPEFGALNELDVTYVYAIEFTRVNGRTTYDTFSDLVTMKIAVAASGANSLGTLANNVDGLWESMTTALTVSSIGVAYNGTTASDRLELTRQFTDRTPPSFMTNYPDFTPDSTAVSMNLGLDRTGTVYYVIAPKGTVGTAVYDPDDEETDLTKRKTITLFGGNDPNHSRNDNIENAETYVLQNGSERDSKTKYAGKDGNLLVAPDYLQIVNPNFSNSNVITGWVDLTGGSAQPVVAPANSNNEGQRLLPNTEYYVYFVIKGVGASYSEVSVYQFKTERVSTPLLSIEGRGETAASTTSSAQITTNMGANVWYALVDSNKIPAVLDGKFEDGLYTKTGMSDADITAFEATYPYAKEGSNSVISDLAKVVGSTNPSVLDAMLTVMSDGSGRSYFDVYANATLRQNVLAYINGTNQFNQNEAPLTRATLSTVANVSQMEAFADIMVRGTEYILVGAAQDLTGQSGFGYKAIRALYRPDTEPPEYTGGSLLELDITKSDLPTDFDGWIYRFNGEIQDSAIASINTLRNAKFSGTVQISFDKELYQLLSTTLHKVVTSNPDTDAGEVLITDVVDCTSGTVTIKSSGSGTTNTYTITFTDIRSGATLTLFTNGYISNADGYNTAKRLTLTFDPTLLNSSYDNGTYPIEMFTPGFRVTWQ